MQCVVFSGSGGQVRHCCCQPGVCSWASEAVSDNERWGLQSAQTVTMLTLFLLQDLI